MKEGDALLKSSTSSRRVEQLDEIVIGKDVLELVSSAMYVDPLTIFREYVQNAADAIDEARTAGLYAKGESGRVEIGIDTAQRKVTIKDNGIGVPWKDFGRRLTALGASAKRGGTGRGFRGVGRLAGLGYAQRLVFRSRTKQDNLVSEMSWDCRLLRSSLRSAEADGGVEELIRQVATLSRVAPDEYPDRFFEVELDGVVRFRSDTLMSPKAIGEYLAQVAPVPFAPNFEFTAPISEAVEPAVKLDTLELKISGLEEPVYRPHRKGFSDEKRTGTFEDIEVFTIPDVDGEPAAVGWILHHEYDGAIPVGTGFKGLRLRVGNVQIGGNALLEELFTESRFNSWSIGEVHILDRRVVPNARRDDFEQNAHYSNLLNQLAPIARAISKRCRTSSKQRQLLRDFQVQEQGVKERLQILQQGGIRREARKVQTAQIYSSLQKMDRLADSNDLEAEKERFVGRISKLRQLVQDTAAASASSPLELLPPHKRAMYGLMIDLIYDCSVNRIAAKSLVDRIFEKIVEEKSAVKAVKTTQKRGRFNKGTAVRAKPAKSAGRKSRSQ
jgi:Histidine kinase-, DNA gyrase B-, and HSP90-like ATPase